MNNFPLFIASQFKTYSIRLAIEEKSILGLTSPEENARPFWISPSSGVESAECAANFNTLINWFGAALVLLVLAFTVSTASLALHFFPPAWTRRTASSMTFSNFLLMKVCGVTWCCKWKKQKMSKSSSEKPHWRRDTDLRTIFRSNRVLVQY